jgi:hypothetical protein
VKLNYFATIISWLEPSRSGHAVTFFALILMLHATTAALLLHGTYFLAGVSTDYVIVAIDSRESSFGAAGPITNDRYCKIRPLSNRVIFFATGTTSAISSKTRATIFDASDIAQHTFEDFTGDNFEDLANRWAIQMKAVYLSYVDAFSFVPDNEIVAEGFFVGLNSHDEIAGSDATILRRSDLFAAFAFRSERIVPGPPGNMPLLNNGHFEILEEFYGSRPSDRAKKIVAETAGWKSGPDTDATRYSSYVAAVRDWSGDTGIGGEIATIILERGKGWRWFHRPDFCPER